MIEMINKILTICNQHVDKFAHLGISVLLYLFLYAITKNEFISMGLVFIIGLLKEAFDYYIYKGFSPGDIFSELLGIALALILVRIILRG